jgi:hypothetical protein
MDTDWKHVVCKKAPLPIKTPSPQREFRVSTTMPKIRSRESIASLSAKRMPYHSKLEDPQPVVPPKAEWTADQIIEDVIQYIQSISALRRISVEDVIDALMKHANHIKPMDMDYIHSTVSYYVQSNGILTLEEIVPTVPTTADTFAFENRTQLLIKRDRFASEATRIPSRHFKYTASTHKKFQTRGFKKWCDLDFALNYADYCETFTLPHDEGKWTVYENGKSIKTTATCIEAYNWMEQYKQTQSFPFPLWVFQLHAGIEKRTCKEYIAQGGLQLFEEELIRELREEEERNMEVAFAESKDKDKDKAASLPIPTHQSKKKKKSKSSVKTLQASNQEVPASSEDVPASNQEVPASNQEVPAIPTIPTNPTIPTTPLESLSLQLDRLQQKIDQLEKQESLGQYVRDFLAYLCTFRKSKESER